jgi:hypothetical protein
MSTSIAKALSDIPVVGALRTRDYESCRRWGDSKQYINMTKGRVPICITA